MRFAKSTFSIVCRAQKTTAAAGRIKNDVAGLPNGESSQKVDYIFGRIKLSQLMTKSLFNDYLVQKSDDILRDAQP